MSKQQKKLQKKKAREIESKKKVVTRREELRSQVREDLLKFRKFKRLEKLKKEMGELNVWADDVLFNMSDKTITQLEHNVKILAALEQEYQTERSKKEALNEELEKDGHFTLEDKMATLHGRMLAEAQKMYNEAGHLPEEMTANFAPRQDQPTAGIGGQAAELEIIKSPRPLVEAAEVEVIKAPVHELEFTMDEVVTIEPSLRYAAEDQVVS